MSSMRQISIPISGRYRQVSLYFILICLQLQTMFLLLDLLWEYRVQLIATEPPLYHVHSYNYDIREGRFNQCNGFSLRCCFFFLYFVYLYLLTVIIDICYYISMAVYYIFIFTSQIHFELYYVFALPFPCRGNPCSFWRHRYLECFTCFSVSY